MYLWYSRLQFTTASVILFVFVLRHQGVCIISYHIISKVNRNGIFTLCEAPDICIMSKVNRNVIFTLSKDPPGISGIGRISKSWRIDCIAAMRKSIIITKKCYDASFIWNPQEIDLICLISPETYRDIVYRECKNTHFPARKKCIRL